MKKPRDSDPGLNFYMSADLYTGVFSHINGVL